MSLLQELLSRYQLWSEGSLKHFQKQCLEEKGAEEYVPKPDPKEPWKPSCDSKGQTNDQPHPKAKNTLVPRMNDKPAPSVLESTPHFPSVPREMAVPRLGLVQRLMEDSVVPMTTVTKTTSVPTNPSVLQKMVAVCCSLGLRLCRMWCQ